MPRSLIENGDEESQPKTATTRRTRAAPVPESPVRRSMRIRHISGKQTSAGDSPETPSQLAKTRRSIRASSETKSPSPAVRITRRTRANSIEPEQTIGRISKAAAPSTSTRRRRTQVSALPTEPIVPEETVDSSSPSPQKSSPLKNYSRNVEMEIDESPEEAKAKVVGKSKSSRSKIELSKLDDTYVDNEVIEEFTLHDSDSSKSDNLKPRLSLTVNNSDGEGEGESNSSDNIFEVSKEKNTVNKMSEEESNKPVMQIKKLSLNLERVSPQGKSEVKISPQKKKIELEKVADIEIADDEETESLEEKKTGDESAKSVSSPENNAENNVKLRVESLSNINSKRDAAEEKCLDADDEGEETETRSAGKNSPRVTGEKNLFSKIERNNRISDSDSSLTMDRLFHDISAEEWNKRRKSQDAAKNRKSDGNKSKSPVTEVAIDSDEDTDVTENKSWRENGEAKKSDGNDSTDSTDSTDTIVLMQKDRSKPGKGQRKPIEKTIVEEEKEESSDEEPAELLENNKSPNKPVKGQRKSIERMIVEEEKEESSDEEPAELLENNKSPNKSPNKPVKGGQRKSIERMIVEEEKEESSDEEPAELPGNNKSPNESKEVREFKSQEEPEVRKPEIASQYEHEEEEERMEVDDVELNKPEIESTSLTDKNCSLSKEAEKLKEIEEAEGEASPKKTPKSEKKKSPIKFGKNLSKKSRDVYEFNDSLDSKEEEETEALTTTPKENSMDERTPKKPFSRNFSMVAVADSESQSDKTFSEEESDDSKQALPGFLFNVESSGEDNDDKETPEKSSNTIDSDIAREMNLAGDDDVAYSDDDVQGDECHASESEHSDEDDGGSDLNDFVVADDAVESSEDSKNEEEEEEENTPRKSKFKRIIDKSSSEEEAGEVEDLAEENSEKEEEEEKKPKRKISLSVESAEKPKRRMSLGAETVTLASASKKLNKSVELVRSSSIKKVKKFDLEDMKNEIGLSTSGKKFKKLSSLVSAALETTVDLCTPEQEDEEEGEAEDSEEEKIAPSSSSPDVSNASNDRKSLDKLRKNLADDLVSFTPDKMETEKGTSSRTSTTPKTQTPVRLSEGSTEKTPKSLKKNKRDSMQIIAECGSITPKSSSLNKTMLTPNSETPVTKFLKKERLNESLPLLELNKKSTKRLSEGPTMSKMLEDQLEEDVSEAEDLEEKADESSNEEKEEDEASEDAQENGKVLNGVNEESEEEGEEEEKEEGEEADEPEIGEEENEDDEEDEREETGAEIEFEEEESVEDDAEEEEESENEEVLAVKSKKNKNSPEKIKVLKKQEKLITRRSKAEVEEEEEKEEEEEEEEESEDEETIDVKRKRNKNSPKEIRKLERQKKTLKRQNKTEKEKDETSAQVKISVTPKNRGRDKSDDEDDEGRKISVSKKRSLLNSANATTMERKKRARLELVSTPQSTKEMQKPKRITGESESDSDEAPESVGFSEARGAALQAMKDVASSLKAAKEAKQKKRREHQARIKEEREAKLASTVSSQSKAKNSLKRLPDDFLFSLSDVSQRPNKKLKLTKKVEQIMPSTSSFEPGKPTKSSIITEKQTSPLSSAGSTTLFSVTNLKKIDKKQAKKAATVASFRDRMLARNPRQPVSAFLVYQAKQKAAGLHSSNRK